MTINRKKIHLVAGARPNFMKVAPLYHELKRRDRCQPVLVHTGQHYDTNMSDVFFRDLNLPTPDHSLDIGGGSHAEQVGKVIIAYEKLLLEDMPDLVIVVGDVNATAACTLAAKKMNLPVAHVEAGLRSRDRSMPEEINRIVTDAICDLHFTPSIDANENLRAEGVAESCIYFVGNVMIDSLIMMQPFIQSHPHPYLQLADRDYGIATFHRPQNVDNPEHLKEIIEGLCVLSRRIPMIFPIHPRTLERLKFFGLMPILQAAKDLILAEPLGYAAFMRCLFDASLVITDSGGVQEETTFLGIPCFTLRPTTERPITITHGTNRLIKIPDIAGLNPRDGRLGARTPPNLWDGKTAVRIADVLERYLTEGAPLRQG
jgi:UDP-N-acetylglucosamine 2-epimerase (non-hydrolysing)